MPTPARDNLVVLRLDAMKEVGATEVPDNGEDLKDLWLELAQLGEVGGRRVWGHGALEPSTFEPLHDLGQDEVEGLAQGPADGGERRQVGDDPAGGLGRRQHVRGR